MADDLHYVGGEYYQICDMTGFKVRNTKTQQQWNGLQVRDQSFEMRQPQDFVRGVRDYQNVPIPRPRQLNVFVGPLITQLTANAVAGATVVSVESTVRMEIGDDVLIMLDNMQNFKAIISNVIDMTQFEFSPPLNWSASSGNVVTDVSAVASVTP